MKKTIISLLVVAMLLVSMMCVPALAAEVLSYGDTVGAETYVKYVDDSAAKAPNYGRKILESDKYIFIAAGYQATNYSYGVVSVYEKPNSENMGYTYLTSIVQEAETAPYHAPVREMWIYNDTLYVSWNNTLSSGSKKVVGLRAIRTDEKKRYEETPVYSYDISNISAEDVLTPTLVHKGGATAKDTSPYNRGGTSFLDEKNGLLYQTIYSGSATDSMKMLYYVYDLKTGKNIKTLKGGQVDTVQFIVKGDYLFEVLQNNNGVGLTTTTQAMNSVRMYDIKGLEDGDDLSSAFIGAYTTIISGDRAIQDIEVCGNILYIATTAGLEKVDLSSFEVIEMLHNEADVKSLVSEGNNLYVGLSDALAVYNVANDNSSLIGRFNFNGGFKDFSINKEENMLYALSGASKGQAVIINLDMLLKTLNVSDVSFGTSEIAEGELTLNMNVHNPNAEDISFKTAYMLYEGNKLVDISIKDWTAESGDDAEVTDTVLVKDKETSHVKVMLLADSEELRVLPMVLGAGTEEESTEFEIEFGNVPASEGESEDVMEISSMDENGNVSVSGQMADFKGKPMLVIAKNTEAEADDRLNSIRYMDIVTIDTDGKYAFDIMPSDSGAYSVSMVNTVSVGNLEGEFSVEQAKISVSDIVEIPDVDANLYINLENGQNVQKINLELSLDTSVITAKEDIISSDEFEVSDIAITDGKISATFTKTKAIGSSSNEFCAIPITIADDAELKDYDIEINATAYDKYDTALKATLESGTLTIAESTPKYEALDVAKEALKAVKDADKLTVDDYLSELSKVKDAREKLEAAYELSVRDSQIGEELIENLKASEEKLAEFKLSYDAVDRINAKDKEEIVDAIKTEKDLLGISEDAIDIYDGLEDTSKIDDFIADGKDYEKPSDVYKAFNEALVLNAMKETGWQNVSKILALAEEALELDLSDYNKLDDDEKTAANKLIDYTEYESLKELQDALDSAVDDAKEPQGGVSSRPTSSNKESSVFIPLVPSAPTQPPIVDNSNEQGFRDISAFGWAETAINHLYENGVINGKSSGIFAPADNVTRAEFAKMVVLAFDIKADGENISFTDVNSADWYYEYVMTLAKAGIINGRSDGSFGASDCITREDISVILDRTANYKGIEITKINEAVIADSEDISVYAKEAVEKMCSAGIISGFGDGSVKPKNEATRAQTAQLIYNVLTLNK